MAASESILIYRLGSLGDTLVALPTFRAVRRSFPTARIVALTNIPVSPKAPSLPSILENTGLVDEAFNYPIGVRVWAVLRRLRKEIARRRFAVGINLSERRDAWKSLRDHLFLRSCGIPRIIGTPWLPRDPGRVPDRFTGLYEWEAVHLARRVSSLGPVDLDDPASWDLALTAAETAAAADFLSEGGIPGDFLAVSVGTKADVNDWTESNWTGLARGLAARFPSLPIVAFGAGEEYARMEGCLAEWRGPKLNLCGRLPIRITAAALARARLFIGHDSGPMHLAATMGVSCVGIFSARNRPGRWYPRGRRNSILYRQTPCFGCQLAECPQFDKMCIRAIGVDEVIEAATNYLRTWN